MNEATFYSDLGLFIGIAVGSLTYPTLNLIERKWGFVPAFLTALSVLGFAAVFLVNRWFG